MKNHFTNKFADMSSKPRKFKCCDILTYSYDIPIFDIDLLGYLGSINYEVKYKSRTEIDEISTLTNLYKFIPNRKITLYKQYFNRDNSNFIFISGIKLSKEEYQRYLRMKKLERVLNND
ncbi:hypothetical protein M0Q97_07045 [Candidatus Dojkabacteria bacterium]|jgi:hypothetical protein|nr:hypothetical protein [Candidatus Dojkabacteria bacterium]